MKFDYASLERRIAALERAQPASLRFGRVTSVNGGKVRVQFGDGQGVVSHEISTLQRRVLKDQGITMPDAGEPVACLFSGQGCEQGVMLGAYYNGREAAPELPSTHDYRRYEDGTEIWYDRVNHKLVAKVQGDAEIETKGGISAKAQKDVKVESQGTVDVDARERIKLRAPQILLAGMLRMTDMDGNPGRAILLGDYSIEQGSLAVPDGDVSAGTVLLRKHRHENSGGSGTGGKPVGG